MEDLDHKIESTGPGANHEIIDVYSTVSETDASSSSESLSKVESDTEHDCERIEDIKRELNMVNRTESKSPIPMDMLLPTIAFIEHEAKSKSLEDVLRQTMVNGDINAIQEFEKSLSAQELSDLKKRLEAAMDDYMRLNPQSLKDTVTPKDVENILKLMLAPK